MGKMKYGGKGSKLHGPLYTPPGKSLGPHEVGEPKGAKMPPDPLGYVKGGKKGK